MVKITITGLRRPQENPILPHVERRVADPTLHTYEGTVPPAWLKLEPSQVARELRNLGYEAPTKLESETGPVKVKVVDETAGSCYDATAKGGLCIRENESFASWWTKLNGGYKNGEVTSTDTSVSVYGTTTTFERTLRVPDSDKSHKLPPSMGKFPVVAVKDHADKVPKMVAARGGYMMPMYQREALWLNFKHQPNVSNAMKVSVGGINALTGAKKGVAGKAGIQDYLCKSQPWLDGIVKEEGKVKQFVAMPVGEGYTIEEQLTGKNTEATLQLDVFPSFRRDAEVKVDGNVVKDLLSTPHKAGAKVTDTIQVRPRTLTGGYTLGSVVTLHGDVTFKAVYEEINIWKSSGSLFGAGPVMSMSRGGMALGTRGCDMPPPSQKKSVSVGIAAGGSITQQIDKDPNTTEIYDFSAGKRIYIHFINAGAWEDLTGKKAPITPVDKKAYQQNDIPWFDLYNEPEPAKNLGAGFKDIKTVKDVDATKKESKEELKEDSKREPKKDSKEDDDKHVCPNCGEAKISDDEKLFGKRWEKGNEGKIVDVDASRFSKMNITSKLPFLHIGEKADKPARCKCHPVATEVERNDGEPQWTYESDNVSPLRK